MVDVHRHGERLVVSGSIAATATLTSQIWDTSRGQMFSVVVEALAGSSPEVNVVVRYYTGMNGGGKALTLTIASAISSAPATPYAELDLDKYVFKSARLEITGTASNHATDTTCTVALMVY